MASSEYRQVSLPKLSTSKEVCRRDSLSSSRTRDSGYSSDLDVCVSPLDFVAPGQDTYFTPLPPVPELLSSRRHPHFDKSLPSHQSSITSNPAPGGAAREHTPHRITSSSTLRAKTELDGLTLDVDAINPALPDDDIEKWIKDNLPSRNRPQERVSSITSLSSTSSCDMYSNTDISDDEQELEGGVVQNLHSSSTLKVVELILRRIEVNLRLRCAAYKQCTGSNTSHARQSAGPVSQQRSHKTSQSSGPKRKSRQEGSPPPDDNDEEGPNKRRRGSTTTTDSSDTGSRFACPFYKHDPDRYRNRRTCPGPGWPTVHRMKEHLYRSHSQPIFCPICYSTFKSDREQSNHVRLQECLRAVPQQIEGIDRETVWTLRKRTTALRLEEDKWRDVYHILFPAVPAADIPSPFYDSDSPSETSRRFRRELLRRVQEELLVEAGQLSAPIEQQLLQRVAQIIRRCEEDLLQMPQTAALNALPSDRRASSNSTASAASLMSVSHYDMPMHAPASSSSLLPSGRANLETHPYATSATPSVGHVDTPYIAGPAIEFAPVMWDEQTYNAFNEGIDWDAVFSATHDGHLGGNEPFATLSAPMYT